MKPKSRITDSYHMLFRLHVALLIGVGFIVVYAFHYRQFGSFASIIGVGILSAGAALLVGFLLGFIFAIPRVSQSNRQPGTGTEHSPDPVGPQATESRGRLGVYPNSNLVEISDWLTKILVGVGLVQLNKIPGKIEALASIVGQGLRNCGSDTCKQSSEALALGIIVFYFSAGFLMGYLWARLYFEKDVENNLADDVNRSWQYTELAEEAINKEEWRRADGLLDQALSLDWRNPKAHLRKAYVLHQLALADGKVVDKAALQQALDHTKEASRLNPTIAAAFYNMACFQLLLGMDRKGVLDNLRKAFAGDSELKKEALTDPDLAPIRDDADFKNLTT